MSETDRAWSRLFDALDLGTSLQSQGYALVSAGQIKAISGREPRLMAKFDTRACRPATLKRADCTVLPVRNGEYVLVKGDGYAPLPDVRTVQTFGAGAFQRLQTLPRVCRSESQVLDVAMASGMLSTFLGEPGLTLTIRGRLRTHPFAFTFRGVLPLKFQVDGVQVEVDAGYEGDRVYIVEAKMGARDDFIVRQLYYPYRMWREQGVSKAIVPLFVTYSNQIFTISEYGFPSPEEYNSVVRLRTASYALDRGRGPPDLHALLATTPAGPEPLPIPFPQANDMRKVIDVIDAVGNGIHTRERITEYYEFAPRQSSYYGDAARYLGFLDVWRDGYVLSGTGDAFVGAAAAERIAMMACAMLKRPVFRDAVEEMLGIGGVPPAERIAGMIERRRPDLRGTTVPRRAGTVARWLEWLCRNLLQGDMFADSS